MKDVGYHRHVISMLACCTKGSTIALVMEFMPFGNLQTFLKKRRDPDMVNLISVGAAYPFSANLTLMCDWGGVKTFDVVTSPTQNMLSQYIRLQFCCLL